MLSARSERAAYSLRIQTKKKSNFLKPQGMTVDNEVRRQNGDSRAGAGHLPLRLSSATSQRWDFMKSSTAEKTVFNDRPQMTIKPRGAYI